MTIGDLVDASRGPRIGTIGDLFKNAGDQTLLDGPDSPERTEAELLSMLEACEATHRDLIGKLRDVKAKMVAGMTPQSRAALEAMGHDLKKSLDLCEELSMKTQRGILDHRRQTARDRIAKRGTRALEEHVATLKKHSDAVLSGRVALDADNRRKLARELIAAEAALQEAQR